MKHNKVLKRQRITFLLSNLFAFLLIFLILGLVAVKAIDYYSFARADKELKSNREMVINQLKNPIQPYPDSIKPPKNPRIIYIIYNQNKEVIQSGLFDDIDITKIKTPLEEEILYNTKIENFNYRAYEFSFNFENNKYYSQIFLNIDGEIALRNNIITIYMICVSVILLLVILISFILSKITMRPIEKVLFEQSRFVSDASHELKTPLTVLHAQLETLLSNPDSKIIDKSEEISQCLSEVIRLTKLSNNLLTLARNEANREVLEKKELNIYELICKVAIPYQEIAQYDNKEFIIQGNDIIVSVDIMKIKQVLIILFDNCLKYTKANDQIKIEVIALKNKCLISIKDNGVGISDKGLNHLFERFYRDDSSRGIYEGNGLGLAIAKQIIEEHNGSITAQHNQPKGLIIEILL